VSKQISRMTFTIAFPFAAFTTASTSAFTTSSWPLFNAPMFKTISISPAPFPMASDVSKAFVSEVDAPSGKPMTVQTFTSLFSSCLAASDTHAGLTQTDAKLYSAASLQSCSICGAVASAFSNVWSIKDAIFVMIQFSILLVGFLLDRQTIHHADKLPFVHRISRLGDFHFDDFPDQGFISGNGDFQIIIRIADKH